MLLQDDGSGRQQFTFTPVNGGYTMTVVNGRDGCADYVAAQACNTSIYLEFVMGNIGALTVWELIPPPVVTTPYFTNGVYQIANTNRAANCATTSVLGVGPCADGDEVVAMQATGLALDSTALRQHWICTSLPCKRVTSLFMVAADRPRHPRVRVRKESGTSQESLHAGNWTLTLLPGAPSPNTYEVVSTSRNGTCDSFLSCTNCAANIVDVYGVVRPAACIEEGVLPCHISTRPQRQRML